MKQFYLLICLIAFIQPLLNIKILNFFDEFLATLSFFYIFLNFNKLSKNEFRAVIFLFLFVCTGLLGTYFAKLQTGFVPLFQNIIAWVKFPLALICSNHLSERLSEESKISIIKKINLFLPMFFFLAFTAGIMNLFVNIGMSNERRMGIRCFSFIYDKAQTFSNSFYLSLFFLVLGYREKFTDLKRKKYSILIILALISWLFTLRSRAFLFVIIFAFLFSWMVWLKKKFSLNIISVLFLVFLGLFVTAERLESTFENDKQPRAALMYYGIKTLKDYFPIGAGLGTYGTDVACTYYSKLYYKYGFNRFYGLNPWDTRYAHDTYWPAVMGETGVIGCFFMIGTLFFVFRECLSYCKNNRISRMICLFVIITHVCASLPTSIFFQYRTVYLFFLLPLLKETRGLKYERKC